MGEGRGGHYETLRGTRPFHVELVVAATEDSPSVRLPAVLWGITARVRRCADAAAVDRCLLAADRRADAIVLWYGDAIWPPDATQQILGTLVTPTYLALPERPATSGGRSELTFLLHDGTVTGALRRLAAKIGLPRAVRGNVTMTKADSTAARPEVRIERIEPGEVKPSLVDGGNHVHRQGVDEEQSPAARAAFLRAAKFSALKDSAAGLAHEINNLVTPIAGYAQLLRTQVEQSDLAERLDIIENSAFRASHLINELLTFMGADGLNYARVEPVAWLNKTVREMGPRVEEHGVRLLLSTPLKLAAVFLDPNKMLLAVEHVVWNAVHAMEESGMGGTIQVSADISPLSQSDHLRFGFGAMAALDAAAAVPMVGDRVLRIDVVDEGPGVPDDLVDRVFFPFVTTRGPDRGRGLGLSVVYGIVRSHGGGIDLRSASGQGTQVSMVVPALSQPVT